MLKCGDTFLKDDENQEKFHLWIVVTPPVGGEIVTVCLVTATKYYERLVVLNQGDHEFITHESAIGYRHSTIRQVDDIEAAIQAGKAKMRSPISPGILKRIQDGLLDSDFTPNGVRFYFRQVMKV